MKIFIVFFFVFFLNGCSSEVDKCVDSLVKARNKYDVAAMQSGDISKIENGKEWHSPKPVDTFHSAV
jgi:PBP1b-binding outer membrane lipoprotein LpoB